MILTQISAQESAPNVIRLVNLAEEVSQLRPQTCFSPRPSEDFISFTLNPHAKLMISYISSQRTGDPDHGRRQACLLLELTIGPFPYDAIGAERQTACGQQQGV
jgi:hypothetical protein